MNDEVKPIVNKQPVWVSNQMAWYEPKDGTTIKLRDSNGGISKAPLPDLVQVQKEGQGGYIVRLFYKPGRAPRSHGKDEMINTGIFDGLTLVVQTGTEEGTGRPTGKMFKTLTCNGWSWKTIEEERYEQVTCTTALPTDWEKTVFNLKSLGPTEILPTPKSRSY